MQEDKQTYFIIGAAMAVHRILGCGFLEAVYQDALEQEFLLQNIPFLREKELPVIYKTIRLNTYYRMDFVCFDSIVVELKAIQELTSREEAQVLNYLKASGMKRALLINFGKEQLEFKRLVLNYSQEY